MPEPTEVPMEVDQTDQQGQDVAKTSSTLRMENGLPVFEEVTIPPPPEAIQSFDGSGPRLMITHIVNENFKSYAGEQTLGPFHKSFSSIVGPNGSGKSNVIDSMLFVFGYRANKIRSKKISVLIHNSEEHKGLTNCTVAVHFQKIIDTGEGDKDYDVVPNSCFVVSRTAFKDNSSYYKLNDRKATYREVATMLRGSGIDLDHNRFLILQGEVEQIAMMKPKALSEHEDGMLEFLEDIVGSSRFKEPIEVLTKRVEELNELRGEKLNRVKAVEKEKDDLEGVKNEALEYLGMENEITVKKNSLYQKYVWDCQENIDKANVKYEDVKKSMDEMTEQFKEISENKKVKLKEHKKIYKQYEELTKKCEESKEKFSEFEQKDVRLREDLKHSKAKSKKLDKQLEQEKQKLSELKQIPEKTERDVADLQKKLDKLETEKAKEDEKLKEVMESLKTETQGLQVEKDGKEKELMDLQKVTNEAKSKYTVARSELSLYLSNLQSEEAKLRETQKNLDNAIQTLKDRKNGLKDMEKRLPQLDTQVSKAKKDLQQVCEREQKISDSVRQARVRVEEARSSLQASSSRGKVIEALMSLKRSGKLPGIYGRLGDLGAIDEKYDVAISTACGALDHIVVDTISTGQKCVEFLKKNNVGLATFIGLDKMQKWTEHCARKINTPDNVPRLFDLVKVQDSSLLPAFYFALRDTLVAKDLDQATKIAYGKTRYRVVTLSGQLIDQSGTMSGGGGKVCKGRMGSAVVTDIDPKELQSMETKLQKETQEMQTCRDTKSQLEVTVEKLERELNEIKHGMEKFKMEVVSLGEQEVTLKTQVQEQTERVKDAAPDEKELKKLEKNVDKLKESFDAAAENANKVEEEVHRLHKQIMDIGGVKLKSAESRVNLVQTQIDQVTGHITKANVAIKTAQRNSKKSEEKVSTLEEEMSENKEKLEQLEAEFKQVEVEATKVMEEYQKAQEAMKDVGVTVDQIKTEVSAFEEQEQSLSKQQIEIRHELEKYETVVKENNSKVKHWKKELGRLTLHKLEGQETSELPDLDKDTLRSLNKEDTQYEITVLEEKLAQMKPNMAAIAEYRKKEELYLKRVGELDQITDMRDSQRKLHESLRKQRLDDFMGGFSVITNKLKEMYQMITLGGDAELELVDSLDPFSEGIVFSVRPPKKSWKNISNLSGGEKTLSSLALVFALHHYKPTPLYVMDEIDAALDFKNVSIVANYIKERTKNAQFIIISLRNNMFELADRLIGIYKTYNCTKSVTINPNKICIPLGEQVLN